MMEGRFAAKLAEILGVPPEQITNETELGAAEWDSVVVLDLLASMDEAYGVTIGTGLIAASRTVGELRSRMRAAGADA
jgi:acyl carrier protein